MEMNVGYLIVSSLIVVCLAVLMIVIDKTIRSVKRGRQISKALQSLSDGPLPELTDWCEKAKINFSDFKLLDTKWVDVELMGKTYASLIRSLHGKDLETLDDSSMSHALSYKREIENLARALREKNLCFQDSFLNGFGLRNNHAYSRAISIATERFEEELAFNLLSQEKSQTLSNGLTAFKEIGRKTVL